MSTYHGWAISAVLNVKALVDTFNQEKALVVAFSMITNLSFEALGAVSPHTCNMSPGILSDTFVHTNSSCDRFPGMTNK